MNTPATVSYELRIVRDRTIRIANQDIKLEGHDAGVIVMFVMQGQLVLSEAIVAVVVDPTALVRLRSHIEAGGQLSLGAELR